MTKGTETMTETTETRRARLIAFAVDCAADELACYADASSHPDSEPCQGMWANFREDFPGHTSEEWDLVAAIYTETVHVLARRAGVEVLDNSEGGEVTLLGNLNDARPLNNSDRVALVWHDGTCYRWHVYVPGSEHLVASGRADDEAEAHRAAASHA